MRIAVIDDCEQERHEITSNLIIYYQNHNIELSLSEFDSGEAFMSTFTPGSYDLIFLDIYMKELNGMEVARKVRSLEQTCRIIFLTSSMDYAVDSYDVNALYYLLKPVNPEKLYHALDLANKEFLTDAKCISVSTSACTVSVKLEDILYVDYAKRKTCFHLKQDMIVSPEPFATYKDLLLADCRFLQSFRTFIVNMDHITQVSDNDFIVSNGDCIPIREREKKECKDTYLKHMLQKVASLACLFVALILPFSPTYILHAQEIYIAENESTEKYTSESMNACAYTSENHVTTDASTSESETTDEYTTENETTPETTPEPDVNPPVLAKPDVLDEFCHVLPQGASVTSYISEHHLDTHTIQDESGETYTVSILWNYDDFDSTTTGQQILYGTFALPEQMLDPNNYNFCYYSFYVCPLDIVDLTCANYHKETDSWLVEWVSPLTLGNDTYVEYSIDYNAWQKDTDEICSKLNETSCILQFSTLLQEYPNIDSLDIRICNNGTYSQLLCFINMNGVFVKASMLNGDRDGGDRGEVDLPDDSPEKASADEVSSHRDTDDSSKHDHSTSSDNSVEKTTSLPLATDSVAETETQSVSSTAPADIAMPTSVQIAQTEPVTEPSSEASTTANIPEDTVTATTTSMSGLRLKQLLAVNEDVISFEKQGICLHIPCSTLEQLSLADNDLITVTIKPIETGFSFAFTVNGKDVLMDNISTISVSMPFAKQHNHSTIVVVNQNTLSEQEAIYLSEQRLATFYIAHTGTYSVLEKDTNGALVTESSTPTTRSSSLLVTSVAGVAGCSCLGILFFYLRKRKLPDFFYKRLHK